MGGRCRRQGRRNSEMAATVVAPTTVAVAAASLGDFSVAAAAVNLEDVAGSRRRKAVVARGVGGGAVGACEGGFGWMALGEVGAWEVGGSGNELGGSWSEFMEIPNE